MKKDVKTILCLILATLTPTIIWIVFVPLTLSIMVLLDPSGLDIANVNLPTQIFRFILAAAMLYFWWGFFFAIFVFILSSLHMLFLGIPTFLIANHLKIIRWYTVLPASFFIGGAPYILFMLGSPMDEYVGVTMTMGLFGFSAGMAFWLLWRYWVSPEDYTKKLFSFTALAR